MYNFIQKLCEISYIFAKESLQNRALRKTKKNPKFAYHSRASVSRVGPTLWKLSHHRSGSLQALLWRVAT